jgi:hypothetical protein
MTKRQNQFRHRQRRDFVAEELVAALFEKTSYDFSELFQAVYGKLRARDATSGGEEMLRLRVYERLQVFVSQGLVKKKEKKYSAVKPALEAYAAGIAASIVALEKRRGAIMHIE